MLLGLFFDEQRPEYMNYGALGWVVGHEITHGFDNTGSSFDDIGNTGDWWKSETKKNYLEKIECLIKQYNNYTIQHLELNVNISSQIITTLSIVFIRIMILFRKSKK